MRYLLLIPLLILFSCQQKPKAELLVYGGNIQTLNDSLPLAEALLIKDGKVLALGKKAELEQQYEIKTRLNLEGKTLLPGWIDAHAHFHGYATTLLQVNLVGTQSWQEVLERTRNFAPQNQFSWILGRGWNQENWGAQASFPDRTQLDSLFPTTPVFLKRIDGHAGIANAKALELAGIHAGTSVKGGEIMVKAGRCTGLLIDEAMSLVERVIPAYPENLLEKVYLQAQDSCFRYGLTALADAGLDPKTLEHLRKLYQKNTLRIGMYAMISADGVGLAYAEANGIIREGNFHVHGLKVYADGALGSRGALLKHAYCDRPGNFGLLITPMGELENILRFAKNKGLQVNTHCIGDSAHSLVLQAYARELGDRATQHQLRWRIEHAQVTAPEDLRFYKEFGIIPSVQPTHATSDHFMADKRLCELANRGYQYKTLLEHAGILALGTDFPVEQIDPRLTLAAAVYRQDQNHEPQGGYFPSQALSLRETILGMGPWAAYAQFEENKRGQLAPGYNADFVLLDKSPEGQDLNGLRNLQVLETWLGGEKVYPKP